MALAAPGGALERKSVQAVGRHEHDPVPYGNVRRILAERRRPDPRWLADCTVGTTLAVEGLERPVPGEDHSSRHCWGSEGVPDWGGPGRLAWLWLGRATSRVGVHRANAIHRDDAVTDCRREVPTRSRTAPDRRARPPLRGAGDRES